MLYAVLQKKVATLFLVTTISLQMAVGLEEYARRAKQARAWRAKRKASESNAEREARRAHDRAHYESWLCTLGYLFAPGYPCFLRYIFRHFLVYFLIFTEARVKKKMKKLHTLRYI